MDSTGQVMTDGLPYRPISDLRNVTLEELTRRAGDGDDSIQDIVALMTGDGYEQSSVSVTAFNSSIA